MEWRRSAHIGTRSCAKQPPFGQTRNLDGPNVFSLVLLQSIVPGFPLGVSQRLPPMIWPELSGSGSTQSNAGLHGNHDLRFAVGTCFCPNPFPDLLDSNPTSHLPSCSCELWAIAWMSEKIPWNTPFFGQLFRLFWWGVGVLATGIPDWQRSKVSKTSCMRQFSSICLAKVEIIFREKGRK